ncbi:MAG TPA: septum formation initiator family protein [Candidatus Staskawiczbacteria bacterium]|nr:septum formation initiator family protein [Candidatus Staskawiczbacteria bacterium]
MDFKKKQKSEFVLKAFFIRVGAFLLFAFAGILIISDIKIYIQGQNLKQEVVKYENQLAQMKEQNKKLEEKIANSDNPDYIEKVAREEQDMQKEGETAVSFVFPDNGNPKDPAQTSEFENLGWLASFTNWIKGLF